MFDTSIVRARAVAGPRRITLLTASLAIHSAAIFAALALSVASTNFPKDAPPQMEIFRTVTLPSTPPPPLGRPAPPKQAAGTAEQKKLEITAPRALPSDVAPQPSAEPTAEGGGAPESATGGGPIGDPSGVPGGVGEGPGGGTGTEIYEPGGAVIAARVLTRVEPRFPQSMIRAVRSATVIVLCVIDKEGKIREPRIVMSSYPPFNQAVLDALQQWKFAPGLFRGQPVDTYFELSVKFEVR